jgi:hypothetical protein
MQNRLAPHPAIAHRGLPLTGADGQVFVRGPRFFDASCKKSLSDASKNSGQSPQPIEIEELTGS